MIGNNSTAERKCMYIDNEKNNVEKVILSYIQSKYANSTC